jgi:hypothetical protein
MAFLSALFLITMYSFRRLLSFSEHRVFLVKKISEYFTNGAARQLLCH